MKVCPRCQKTYSDDNLNFCLDDGTVLTQASAPSTQESMPETVFMSQPRQTAPHTSFGNEPSAQTSWNPQASPYAKAPAKKSRAWIWVLGILALVTLVGGGGLVGFIVYVASLPDNTSNHNGTNRVIANNKSTPGPINSSKVTTDPEDSDAETIDL